MILHLHHRYRVPGGEEAAVADLMWLVRERLGEDCELLERRSDATGRARAAVGMLTGGLEPDEVAAAVRRTRARIVHAHNLHPTFGWRSLAAARGAGARIVMHLHQYRLVCAIGVCFRDGVDCTRCHARNTLPGIAHNCRGSRVEGAAYGAGLAAWQRRLTAQVDAFIVPSAFARDRLRTLGAPVTDAHVLPHVTRALGANRSGAPDGPALVAARLAPEKGVGVAIEACRIAGVPLVVAGDGPDRGRLAARAAGVTFVGQIERGALDELRATASVALVPSLSGESFGLAAAEAMAAGLPVVATRVGGLPELVPPDWLVAPGDAPAMAAAIGLLRGDRGAGARALQQARSRTAPEIIAPALGAIYDRAQARR